MEGDFVIPSSIDKSSVMAKPGVRIIPPSYENGLGITGSDEFDKKQTNMVFFVLAKSEAIVYLVLTVDLLVTESRLYLLFLDNFPDV